MVKLITNLLVKRIALPSASGTAKILSSTAEVLANVFETIDRQEFLRNSWDKQQKIKGKKTAQKSAQQPKICSTA